MAEPTQPPKRLPRLVGIDLPGVQIDAAGHPPTLLLAQPRRQQPQREQPQVATTADRQSPPQQVEGQRRELQQLALICLDAIGRGRGTWDAVVRVPDRKDGAVDPDTGSEQLVNGPGRPPRHRPRARTEGIGAHPGNFRQKVLGATQVLAHAVPAEVVEQAMVEPVAAQLVTGSNDVSHQCGSTFGDPTEEVEGRLGALPVEEVQQATRRVDTPELMSIPVGPVDQVRHVQDLKPVLDVHGDRMADGHFSKLQASSNRASSSARQRASAAPTPPGPSA